MALRRKPGGRENLKQRPPRAIEHNGFYPYLVRFLEWSEVQENVSAGTVRKRDTSLRRFIDWCDERGLHDPREVTLPILERYRAYLHHYRKEDGTPLTAGSQTVLLAPLRAFFKWLVREKYLPGNPASELMMPRVPKQLPKIVLHQEEVERVLNQPDLGTPDGIRDRAILELLYATGMRRMELCGLDLHDIDHRRQAALIRRGKGNKDRMVPLGERALGWVLKYLNEARPLLLVGDSPERLFLTDYGEAFSIHMLGHRVRRLLDAAGIDKPGSCHLLRHACATHMLENGADIRFIQALLGHEMLSTTQIYTQVSIEKLKAVHALTHPAKLRTVKGRDGEERMALLATLDWEREDEDREDDSGQPEALGQDGASDSQDRG